MRIVDANGRDVSSGQVVFGMVHGRGVWRVIGPSRTADRVVVRHGALMRELPGTVFIPELRIVG